MKIIYKDGDALAGPEDFVLHGCNAHGVMGSGIAAQVRVQFPKAYEAYRKAHEEVLKRGEPCLELGLVIPRFDNGKVILNGVTQRDYGRDPKVVYVSYDAIRIVIERINAAATEGMEVAMPMIGAGLANGDWSVIERIIEAYSPRFQPVVYRWKP